MSTQKGLRRATFDPSGVTPTLDWRPPFTWKGGDRRVALGECMLE